MKKEKYKISVKILNMDNNCPWHIEMILRDYKNGGMNVVHHQHKDL